MLSIQNSSFPLKTTWLIPGSFLSLFKYTPTIEVEQAEKDSPAKLSKAEPVQFSFWKFPPPPALSLFSFYILEWTNVRVSIFKMMRGGVSISTVQKAPEWTLHTITTHRIAL